MGSLDLEGSFLTLATSDCLRSYGMAFRVLSVSLHQTVPVPMAPRVLNRAFTNRLTSLGLSATSKAGVLLTPLREAHNPMGPLSI